MKKSRMSIDVHRFSPSKPFEASPPLLWGLATLHVAEPNLVAAALRDLRRHEAADGAWALRQLQIECPELEEMVREATEAPQAPGESSYRY